MKMPRIIRRRRAVSPVLAAILLIGLAVAAAAVLFVVVLPMIAGTADVKFVSAIAADRNSDGRLDKITVQIQNKGAGTDTFAEGSINLAGWSVTGNVEVGSANPVDLVFQTNNLDDQVEETASVSITLSFDASADITLTETDIDMDQAATLTQSDMLIDFTDSYGIIRSNTTGLDQESTGAAAETHSGTGGFRVRMDDAALTDDYVYRHQTNSDDDVRPVFAIADSPETITIGSTPVLSFWIKKELTGTGGGGVVPSGVRLRVGFTLFDGSSYVDNWVYNQFEARAFTSTYTENTWVRVYVDLPSLSGVVGGNTISDYPSATIGGFSIWIDNETGSGNLNLYVDDVSVHEALS